MICFFLHIYIMIIEFKQLTVIEDRRIYSFESTPLTINFFHCNELKKKKTKQFLKFQDI